MIEDQTSKKNDYEKLDKYLDMPLEGNPEVKERLGMVTSFKYKNSYCKGRSCFKSIKPSAKKKKLDRVQCSSWGTAVGAVPAEAGQGQQGLSVSCYLIPPRLSIGVVEGCS